VPACTAGGETWSFGGQVAWKTRAALPNAAACPPGAQPCLRAVQELRERFPGWGKDQLAVLLRRSGWKVGASMVGRILRSLRARGLLPEPLALRIAARKRLRPRRYAQRKPKDYAVRRPGDLVQLDTLNARPLPGVILKHFAARDPVCKWDVLELAGRATAATAARFLDSLQARMPSSIRALQVDGGSEICGAFEQACHDPGLRLFVLPPHTHPSSTAVWNAPIAPTPRRSTTSTTETAISNRSTPRSVLGSTSTTASARIRPLAA